MVWDFLKDDFDARLPHRARVVLTMATVGVLTGLISSLPTPLPSIRLEEDGLVLNTASSPLHAGLAFAAGVALCMWFWVTRELGKCLLTFVLVFLGWLAAVNTANDLYQALVGSTVFGTEAGAKEGRRAIALAMDGSGLCFAVRPQDSRAGEGEKRFCRGPTIVAAATARYGPVLVLRPGFPGPVALDRFTGSG